MQLNQSRLITSLRSDEDLQQSCSLTVNSALQQIFFPSQFNNISIYIFLYSLFNFHHMTLSGLHRCIR